MCNNCHVHCSVMLLNPKQPPLQDTISGSIHSLWLLCLLPEQLPVRQKVVGSTITTPTASKCQVQIAFFQVHDLAAQRTVHPEDYDTACTSCALSVSVSSSCAGFNVSSTQLDGI
jgi:hypothetical protein